MPDHRQHGRRRATTPKPTPQSRGRHWAFAPPTPSGRARLARQLGTVTASGLIAVIGLTAAHAGTPHSSGATADASTEVSNHATQPQVTASKDVQISFATPVISSTRKPAPPVQPPATELALTSTNNPQAVASPSTSRPAATMAPAPSSKNLRPPLAAMTVNSPFGYRSSPLTGATGELHTGLDLAATCSTAVFAADSGTVTEAGWSPYGGGNRIVIDHGNGIQTSYNHLESIGVSVGQQVTQGMQLAGAGTTGNSTGCHLHFEVMVNGDTVNPSSFL